MKNRVFSDGINSFRVQYDFLSNFYPAAIEYNGLRYYSAEAAFQAQKCVNPEERKQFSELYADEAKKLGRKVDCRRDWETVKLGVMSEIVRTKFFQNRFLAQWLVDTGKKPLREGNHWHDVFWGVDGKTGEGENHLGCILMDVRDELNRDGLPPEREPEEVVLTDADVSAEFGDITQTAFECLVNAANETLLVGPSRRWTRAA